MYVSIVTETTIQICIWQNAQSTKLLTGFAVDVIDDGYLSTLAIHVNHCPDLLRDILNSLPLILAVNVKVQRASGCPDDTNAVALTKLIQILTIFFHRRVTVF